MSLKNKTNFSPNYHAWHTIIIRDNNRSFISQLQFSVKVPHIRRMSKIKKIGNHFGFMLELRYVGKEKDRILKHDKKIFIYPYQNKSEAYSEYLELKHIRKKCLNTRRNFLLKKREEEKNAPKT